MKNKTITDQLEDIDETDEIKKELNHNENEEA